MMERIRLRRARSLVPLLLSASFALPACAGNEFRTTSDGGGAPAAFGGAGVGGSSDAGVGTGGLGSGGLGNAGAGPGTPDGTHFPTTSRLDDFNRDEGALGSSWIGATTGFTVSNRQLLDSTSGGRPLLWKNVFGAPQEVFATLSGFNEQMSEINLVMRAQAPEQACELVEVLYEPNRKSIGVDFCVDGQWTELEPYVITFDPGDQLGARSAADGTITVYRNGKPITTFDASGFPHLDGYIGVNSSTSDGEALWDDFGGGTQRQ